MIPADQLHNAGPGEEVVGDCWRTAIACVLDIPPADVPHFVQEHGGYFAQATLDWLAERDMRGEFWNGPPTDYEGHVIATGPSPRGDWLHAVVAYIEPGLPGFVETRMVHDPHPSRDFLAGPPVEWFLIRGGAS
ncbi:hypothetical protein [Isoptericola sp. NPDC055881]